MMNIFYHALILAFFSVGLGTHITSAATESFPGIVSYAGCSGVDCSACNLVKMVNGGVTWLIGLLFVVFAVIMAIAGIGLVISGGNQAALESAKKKFLNSFIGIMIVLSAWLIVDTLMRTLVGDSSHKGQIKTVGSVNGWLYWSQVSCQKQTKPTYVATSLAGVGSWTTSSTGITSSPCDVVGYSAGAPTYNCSAQMTQCTANGAGIPVVSGTGDSVTCNPDPNVNPGSTGACTPLTSISDSLAQQMENGETLIWQNTDPRLQVCAGKKGGSISSAYRPQAYQNHLKELHTKWCEQGLQSNTDSSCAAVKSQVSAEMSKHGLNCSRPVANVSNHTGGIAVDISGASHDNSDCLAWFGSPDPVHYTLISGCSCQ